MAYQTMPHSSTKASSFQMLYGRELGHPNMLMPTLLLDSTPDNSEKYMDSLTRQLIEIQHQAYEKVTNAAVNKSKYLR